MRYEEIVITPDMAREILLRNDTNRRFEPKRADYYAKDMIDGKWQLNGEDIEISVSGMLKNGQHRLNAIIKANIPVLMGVKFDVDDDVSVYDRGRTRSTSDVLTMQGMDRRLSNSTFISIVKLHYLYFYSTLYVTDFEIESFLKNHEETFHALSRILKGRQSRSQGTRINCKNAILLLAAFYALEAGVDEETMDQFFKVIYTGVPDSIDQKSALVLRNDIQSEWFKTNSGGHRKELVPIVEKAIFDFVNHYQRKISYKNTKEKIYSSMFKEANK